MIKKDIVFYGMNVSSNSKQMYKLFSQVVLRQTGKNMQILEMNQGKKLDGKSSFAKAVSTSVTKTITQTLTTKTMKS